MREGQVLPITGTLTQGVNAQQTITPSAAATEGSFTLTFASVATAAIAWDCTAATVQAALEAHASIGTGNVTVTGGPISGGSPAAFTVTFVKDLGGKPATAITVTDASSLKVAGGGACTLTVNATATVGVIGTYRGVPTTTVVIKTDGIGIAYKNTGTSNTPTWTACEELQASAANNAWGY